MFSCCNGATGDGSVEAVGAPTTNKGGVQTKRFDNGATYEGEWLNEKRHGQGTQTWADGAEYKGQWVNDKAQGWGIFKHVDGDVYEGQWKRQGRRQGHVSAR
jgi:hypothetical protein